MKSLTGLLSSLASNIHTILVVLLPLFFLTVTQEFYATNKFYLLGFAVLALLAVLTLQFLVNKKISWVSSPLDTGIIAFVILYTTSLLVASPNKIQAALNPTHGVGLFVFLTLLYFITVHFRTLAADAKKPTISPLSAASVSAFFVALLTIVFFFDPFKNAQLPSSVAFLKNPQFTPLGTQLDLALFLGFFVVFTLSGFLDNKNKKPYTGMLATIVLIVGLSLSLFVLFKPFPGNPQIKSGDAPKSLSQSLPPFSISWYAGLESLKNWKTAVFGFGVDNFASVFTRVKPASYNGTPLWRVNFNEGRSMLLQLWSEGGLLTIISFLFILGATVKLLYNQKPGSEDGGRFSSITHLLGASHVSHDSPQLKLGFLYLVAALLFFPGSFGIFFLLFLLLAQVASNHSQGRARTTDLSHLVPVVGLLVAIVFVAIAASSYFLGRTYVAEYYFKSSLDALNQNNGQEVYTNMRQAIIFNPYIERYRTSFSQLNLLLANNLAAQAQTQNQQELSEADRQNIAQAVQAAIAEAKAVVILNQEKAANWENLALTYRNIINVAEGADAWTVSSFQRAIVLDPQNPVHRLNLGGVMYSLGAYKDAVRFFEQAVSLKPDWSNAHYNLAWASYQDKDYQTAVAQMQNVLSLLDPKADAADYKRAQKELEEFKKNLPAQTGSATDEEQGGTQLQLQTPQTATVEPKLQLENDAEPPVTPTPEEATSSAQ